MQVWSLGQEDSLEKGTATHSSILAWRIPWTEEPGGPQSMGSHRVGHDRSNLASMHTVWLKLPEVSCLDQKIHYGQKKTFIMLNLTCRDFFGGLEYLENLDIFFHIYIFSLYKLPSFK